MTSARHLKESWIGRLCLGWALMLASLAFVGLATPASAAPRPATEYCAAGRTALTAATRQAPRTALSPDRPDIDETIAPALALPASDQPRQAHGRAYEATGPPQG